ncbi:hypothetical protein EJ04DRAFT_557431 [Polyplosphaeria fusca]|uniref:Heterokaryon incompatibility domain-containing protein n=1 Tax=Polyplosphaeria fusca TaxID=682080 RepID=A0A9P4QKX4_9PLEO|nr:hypothetical protein EJ04DRAFT_557431 [Polyplosphaeria fusca]
MDDPLPKAFVERLRSLDVLRDTIKDINESGWCPGYWSLGALAFRLPPSPCEPDPGPDSSATIYPLKYWYRMNYYIAIGGMNAVDSPLWRKASSEHVVAYSLLHDWWTARYQDPAFSLGAINFLTEEWEFTLGRSSDDEHSEAARRSVLDHLRLRRSPTSGAARTPFQYTQPGSKHAATTYDRDLWDLFFHEFILDSCYDPHYEMEEVSERRVSMRKTCAVGAYCQYLAWSLYDSKGSPNEDLSENETALSPPRKEEVHRDRHIIRTYCKRLGRSITSAALCYSRQDTEAENTSSKDATSSSAAQRSNDSSAPLPSHGQASGTAPTSTSPEHDIELTELLKPDQNDTNNIGLFDIAAQGPIWNPCPWSTSGEVMDDLYDFPRYLWDRQELRTVVVSDLIHNNVGVRYVAISHTWGRWSKDKPIPIDGVPWLVPQNTRFKVQDLPNILLSIPSEFRFVWMDLVCIPQDRSEEGAREISRQAKVFRGASQAIAWFTDVESFEGLEKILAWWTLELLHVHGDENEQRRVALKEEVWSEISDKQTGLLQPRSGPLTVDMRELNPWFTSLWTLQEVCLRPDMWLCSRDWKPLSCSGMVPVPLSGVVAVIQTQNEAIKERAMKSPLNKTPVAIFELRLWRLKSELHKLLDLDRAAIITLGDRRHCTERRAEAIMSALGTVEWYNKALSDHGPENLHKTLETDLVLGKYPLAFLNELARKVPADFFGAFRRANTKSTPGGLSPFSTLPQEGTMMPFCRTAAFFADGRLRKQNYIDQFIMTHESLYTWRVEQSGAARLPQVCMISSKAIAADALREKKVLPCMISGHPRKASDLAAIPRETRDKLGDSLNFDQSQDGAICIDFHTWIAESPCEVYAVLTNHYKFKHDVEDSERMLRAGCGLILERLNGVLVKAADVLVIDVESIIDILEIETVDWVVS